MEKPSNLPSGRLLSLDAYRGLTMFLLMAEKRLFPTAKDKGVAVFVNRPYESGQLFRKTKKVALPSWAKDYDINSWGQYFLKFILSHPAITCVIPGTSKLPHLQDNMGVGLGNLPDEKGREKLATFLKNL